MSLTTQLREAIDGSGVSLYRIALSAEMPYAALHKFANGKRGLNLESADKLAEAFGMHLTRPKRIARK